ncbi:serine/threonine-protein kinase [Streptomyces xiangluensis]|uniref:Serine/threonine-protein kinase n=1 Tax=Streptomyces xiangluensis TaxID=2665720 RepID=A0ABV8YJA5_9ACTN
MEPLTSGDPSRIGTYQLLGRLGVGGMGRVYLGQSQSHRLVAIKVIKSDLLAEAADHLRARFDREIAAIRKVSGFYTAAVVDSGVDDAGLPWLATAYVPAPSLAQIVAAGGPLPVQTVQWLAAGIAEALISIHAAGVVHRDLKPSNVLVASDGPRVIDFGIARAIDDTRITHGVLGTPAFMSPEQAIDTRKAGAASDVFSLGSTLVYAVTGRAPYHGSSPANILLRLVSAEPDLTGIPP